MKIRILALAALASALSLTACKKSSKSDDNTVDLNTQVTQHSEDQSRISGEMDAVDNDVNDQVEGAGSPFGRVGETARVMTPPCNVTVTFDSTTTLRRMTLTFNGANCANTHTRTGTIVVTMPRAQHWRDSGVVLTEAISNLRITRLSDNKSITINGNRSVTNVSGGRWEMVATGAISEVVHHIAGEMTVTFDDNTQRLWHVARRRVLSRIAGTTMLQIGVSGLRTANGVSGIAEWGINRYGNEFSTQILETLKMRSDCNFRLGAGKIQHNGVGATTVVTYGLDSTGAAQGCPGPTGLYYFKAVYTGANGNSVVIIRPYY
jgi:hypothetical protein